MSLPSPFSYLDWSEAQQTLTVVTPQHKDKQWYLISVDGIAVEDIIKAAKADGGSTWLHNFAVMFPNYVLMASKKQEACFVITGEAAVELEDADTHEIEELTCEATEDAYEAAVQSWRHDKDEPEYQPNAEGSAAQPSSNERHDTGGEDEEDKEAYLEKRHTLDTFAALFDATNRVAVKLQLTPSQIRGAFAAAGGVVLDTDAEMEHAETDMAVAAFLQEASAAGGQQQCHHQ